MFVSESASWEAGPETSPQHTRTEAALPVNWLAHRLFSGPGEYRQSHDDIWRLRGFTETLPRKESLKFL